jgi:Ser/Thr protein kinase RdoA (MazF antagonist)
MSSNIGIPPDVLHAFGYYENFSVTQNGDGLINTTFFIKAGKTKTVLQKINRSVFKNAEDIQSNYVKVYNYIEQHTPEFMMPKPMVACICDSFFVDTNGDFWRGFRYVANSAVKHFITDAKEAYTVAALFGRLLKALDGFPVEQLQETIPQFHNLHIRYQQFTSAVKDCDKRRKARAVLLIESLKRRQNYVALYDEVVIQKDKFPLRVLHHDAKIANILFDKRNGKVLCAVDFDTLMPGYFFSDFGDLVRASACSAGEEETDLSKVFINQEYFDALLKGYLDEIQNILTESERALLVYSGHLLIYMQCLRFATDYLLGDIYYKTSYPNQNFNRAMNQLTLLESLEKLVPESVLTV